jgi:hypothetical protein
MNEFLNYNKCEAFIEEPLDPMLIQDTVEEVEAIPLYKLDQGKLFISKPKIFKVHFIYYL